MCYTTTIIVYNARQVVHKSKYRAIRNSVLCTLLVNSFAMNVVLIYTMYAIGYRWMMGKPKWDFYLTMYSVLGLIIIKNVTKRIMRWLYAQSGDESAFYIGEVFLILIHSVTSMSLKAAASAREDVDTVKSIILLSLFDTILIFVSVFQIVSKRDPKDVAMSFGKGSMKYFKKAFTKLRKERANVSSLNDIKPLVNDIKRQKRKNCHKNETLRMDFPFTLRVYSHHQWRYI